MEEEIKRGGGKAEERGITTGAHRSLVFTTRQPLSVGFMPRKVNVVLTDVLVFGAT